MKTYRVEALEKFIVRTVYNVEADNPEQAEAICRNGQAAYDEDSIEEGGEEWLETVSVRDADDDDDDDDDDDEAEAEPAAVHHCSVCGEANDPRLDARIVHASGIYPSVKYCPHCGQYPANIFAN